MSKVIADSDATALVPGPAIRRATAADVEQIVALERASFSDPWTRRSFEALLRDQRVLFAVAVTGAGRVVGYVVAWFVLDEAEVANLAVEGGARGQGVGRALLDTALDEARRNGVRVVYLEVRESNAAARRLYAGRGFVEMGRRRGYYRKPTEDALVLRLALRAENGPGT